MNTLIKYGIDIELADIAKSKNLNISTIRNTSKNNLIGKYNLPSHQAEILKRAVKRQPIDEDIVQELLERSAFTCCLCHGNKSDSYIIHHIEHYNISQDSSYENLAVLCPNDHELAHREGEALANKISPKQIIKAKNSWEKRVESNAIRTLALESNNVNDLDYINVNRVLELALQINKEVPDTIFSERLNAENLILSTGNINPQLYEKYNLNKNTPLKFFAMYGSTMLIQHYYKILLETFSKVKLYDLDDLLKVSELKKGIVGKYCFYTGGVYGRTYKGDVIDENSEPTIIHFRRKPFFVEWKVDPMFITSSTATWRIGRRPIYLVYGKILDVSETIEKKEKRLLIDIRPYAFGIPNKSKQRTPDIHYRDIDYNDYE
ncbi:HNH endonuclease signature motif containing protein [Pareuzebyella sediminis]|uniref:HNH endonuclease signature motif containing protein n=1 Tax=Pareuzebyella sediminis TaxID=2607998 RepID=UPI0011EF15BD|nr:HNH endonuclease signature motif containing protein [Pareuzebyella sediminis]